MARRPRYPYEVPAQVRSLSGDEARWLAATTRDLGEGGLCLVTEAEMPLGQGLKVHLELGPPAAAVDFLGRVVWAHPDGSGPRVRCGVRIELLEVPHALQIQQELERLAARQARAALEVAI